MKKERRNISAQDKVAILRRHLVDKVPVSDLCDEQQIQPAQFYQWQKIFFENGAGAFAKSSGPRATSQAEQRMTALENKLKRKDEVIAEIMADYLVLKKELGES